MAETLSLSFSLTPWPRERDGGKRFPCLAGCCAGRPWRVLERQGPFAPAPFPRPELRAGVLRKLAQIFDVQIFV